MTRTYETIFETKKEWNRQAEGLTEEEEMQLREARAEQIREEKRQLMKKKHRASIFGIQSMELFTSDFL
ncbi:hypothetical protein ANCDUO_11240 [Ancylostoma duodenale]|uniref:Uncharacterized protein n=1 Tax=Ancylostoma duodenale TaxID=51022 RepID=A0A0C2D8R3_9BILA|nr:hypothetical protein ANCDUO_11240 [Ancylostoma duodenale]